MDSTVSSIPAEAYSVPEFCAAHRISRSKLYDLMADGRGPRTFRVGRRLLISREAAADWRRRMEQASEDAVA